MDRLYDKLKKLNRIPMHMPGHKRNAKDFDYLKGFADIDITEIDGFDDLHNAKGILKESMQSFADLRGADRVFYLVNGSTCGILASITAVLNSGDSVIVARNCHKSVYNAIELCGANPIFVYPEYIGEIAGSIKPCDIELAIKQNPEVRLVILTSPTYEGVISDIKGICCIAHKNGIPVLIDAAHGAHLGYFGFSTNATVLGADIVIESLHKTLPSLTQTAICTVSGKLADAEKIEKKLAVFETSSPSYILMSSIDGCMHTLKNDGKRLFSKWKKNLDYFYKNAVNFENIRILSNENGKFFDLDRSKIVIFAADKTGSEFANSLRNFGIEPEMVSKHYVILMTGLGDTKKHFTKLIKALKKLDKELVFEKKIPVFADFRPKKAVELSNAVKMDTENVKLSFAIGRICGDYIWAYPPGIPILVPGEEFTKEAIDVILEYKKFGVELHGGLKNDKIVVIK